MKNGQVARIERTGQRPERAVMHQGSSLDHKLIIVGLFLLMTLATFSRNQDWKDPERLWTKAVESSPLHARPRLNLANLLMERQDFDGALFQFQTALKNSQIDRTPLYQLNVRAGVLIRLSEIDLMQGRFDRARRYIDLVLLEWPQLTGLRFNRAVAKLYLGDCSGARADFLAFFGANPPQLPQC